MKSLTKSIIILVPLFTAIGFAAFYLTALDDSHDIPIVSQQYQYKFESKAVKDENNRQTHHALFSYSHDYGQTWTEPENLAHDESTFASMIIHDNKPYLTWHEQYAVWLADSDDNGATIKKKPLWSGDHPQLASFGDKLFITWMTEEPDTIWLSISIDDGQTFSDKQRIFTQPEKISPYTLRPEAHFVTDDNSVILKWKSSISDEYGTYHFQNVVYSQTLDRIGETVNLDKEEWIPYCVDEFNKMNQAAKELPKDCGDANSRLPVQCEPVPFEAYIREMVHDEFFKCVFFVDDWAYLTEANHVAQMAFSNRYLQLKMDKANHNEELEVAITFSGYKRCLDDFSITITDREDRSHTPFKHHYDKVCGKSKESGFQTYREVDVTHIESITLPQGNYFAELYDGKYTGHDSKVINKFYFSSHWK